MTDNERQEPVKPDDLLAQSTTRRKVMGGSIAAGLGIFGGAMMRGGVLAALRSAQFMALVEDGVAHHSGQDFFPPSELVIVHDNHIWEESFLALWSLGHVIRLTGFDYVCSELWCEFGYLSLPLRREMGQGDN